jgi:hypothetical protein
MSSWVWKMVANIVCEQELGPHESAAVAPQTNHYFARNQTVLRLSNNEASSGQGRARQELRQPLSLGTWT